MALRWIIVFFGLGLAAAELTGDTDTDVDEGRDWDIFDINEAAGLDLLEGDILHDEAFSRNTIIGDKYRWPTTIPYYLEDSLGNRHVGKQQLSIGKKCDSLGTVEHEFLHALGFWHEQSRADRDDYVTIMQDHIRKKKTTLH
ncbi:Meprin A subunit beta [Larimichthys crocea]|uniref:Uncharacterized protein n=1 Tax=Larimichthys crocea TaxID=215358 RepID=A0ACD3RPB8_LARCR|nr:Meprin A subunit beta [Larimichthys crocea]